MAAARLVQQKMTGSKRRRHLAIIAVVGAAVIALSWAFLEFQPFRHDAISFEVARDCKADGPDSKADRAHESFAQKWEGGQLVIRAVERSSCGRVHSVSAQIVGGHVFLRLKYGEPGKPPAACLCMHDTIVRLKSVENRTYFIHRIGFARLGG